MSTVSMTENTAFVTVIFLLARVVAGQTCTLDNVLTFGLSLAYATASMITLICVAYLSFRSVACMFHH